MFRELVIAKRRAEEELIRDLALAWHIANWSGPGKKLPDLNTVLKRVKAQTRQQSREEQQSIIYQLAAVNGLEVKRIRLVKREKPA